MNCLPAQFLLCLFPQLAAYDRFVLSGVTVVLVPDLTNVNGVGKKLIERTA
jgi:hypothetical protein